MEQTTDIQAMLKQLSKADLKQPQALFIKSLNKWYKQTGELSEKQTGCLKSIYNDNSEITPITIV
jgi:hypothetical protein